MASLQFQIHTDQENLGSSVKGSKGQQRTVSGIRGKTFQSGTPFMPATPRRALGDVNCNRGPPVSGKPAAPLKPLSNESGTKEPVLNILKLLGAQKENKGLRGKSKQPLGNKQGKHVQKEGSKKLKCQASEVRQRQSVDVEEIETMPIPPKTKDDFRDICPRKERIGTYIERLTSWQIPCLFGIAPVSDDEDDDEIKLREMIDRMDTLPKPAVISSFDDMMEPECETFPLSPLDDISFPFIDETVVLPSLEDSFSVIPRLEKLQIDMD